MTTFCRKCNELLRDVPAYFNEEKHFLLCERCNDDVKLYSKSFCVKQLNISNLVQLKYLCHEKVKYYLEDDIETLVKDKFKDIQKKEKGKMDRKTVLLKMLADHKLDYKNYGDCYTYVNYGYPELEIVVQNELDKSVELAKRKKLLAKKLKKYNIPYNEKNLTCYNFIYGISDKLDVDGAKVENFFMTHTDYPALRDMYPDDVAKDIALKKYLETSSDIHEIATQLIDNALTIRLD